MKDIKILEYYTPKEVAELLKISAPTLRKYCNLIKKENGQDFFKRDDSNGRLFVEKDIDLLKRIISLKKAPAISLDNAVSIALKEVSTSKDVSDVSVHDTSDYINVPTDIALIQNYEKIVKKQDTQISQLTAITGDLINSNIKLSKQVETLLNELETAKNDTNPIDDKRSWIAKLFNMKS